MENEIAAGQKYTVGSSEYEVMMDESGELYLRTYNQKHKIMVTLRFNNHTNDFKKTIYDMI